MSSATKAFRTPSSTISTSESSTRASGSGNDGTDAGGGGGGDISSVGGDTEAASDRCGADGGGGRGGGEGNSNMGADQCKEAWDVEIGLPPLIPPFRFACVEHGIYRGAHPSLLNLRFLTRLQLRSVISLLPPAEADNPSRDLVEFCKEYAITHHLYQLNKYNDGFSHTAQFVAELLTHLLNVDNHPVFMHCMDGRQNTGIVVMCLRKLQNWGLKAIVDEFSRYTKDSSFEYGEQNFVQRFDTFTVELPKCVPVWFLHRVGLVSTTPSLPTPTSLPDVAPHVGDSGSRIDCECVDVNSMSQ